MGGSTVGDVGWLTRPEVLIGLGAGAGKALDFIIKRYFRSSDAQVSADTAFRTYTTDELARLRDEIREVEAREDTWRRRYYRLLHAISASTTFEELRGKVEILEAEGRDG
jgi:hypothetical protein